MSNSFPEDPFELSGYPENSPISPWNVQIDYPLGFSVNVDERPYGYPGLLPDYEIRKLCQGDSPMILPFSETLKEEGVISHGLTSYGYDISLAPEFKIFNNLNYSLLDPKNIDPNCFVEHKGDTCIIPPNSFILGRTNEYFIMPENIHGIVVGKSTYARVGINCLVTPLEAGWRGELVVELTNGSPLPVKIYAGEGVAQVMFLRGAGPCDMPYSKRNGKYMNQTGITHARIK